MIDRIPHLRGMLTSGWGWGAVCLLRDVAVRISIAVAMAAMLVHPVRGNAQVQQTGLENGARYDPSQVQAGAKGEEHAIDEYRKAAERGDAMAQFNLGNMYLEGIGVPQNDKLAADWFRKAAEQGYAPAQNNLGALYMEGRNVPQDYKQAVDWFRKAAEQGDAGAQTNLGALYANGVGVAKDEKQAAALYRRVAEQGDLIAQLDLADCYLWGKGVPKNLVLASMLLQRVFGREFMESNSNLKQIAAAMTPAQRAEAKALADAWKPGTPLPIETKN